MRLTPQQVIERAAARDHAWRLKQLRPVHRRALDSICKGLGMKPLKPKDWIIVCPACGDETFIVREKEQVCLCLACMECCNVAALPQSLQRKPPRPPRKLVESYQRTIEPSCGNAREFTRKLATNAIIDDGGELVQ